MMQLQSIRIS